MGSRKTFKSRHFILKQSIGFYSLSINILYSQTNWIEIKPVYKWIYEIFIFVLRDSKIFKIQNCVVFIFGIFKLYTSWLELCVLDCLRTWNYLITNGAWIYFIWNKMILMWWWDFEILWRYLKHAFMQLLYYLRCKKKNIFESNCTSSLSKFFNSVIYLTKPKISIFLKKIIYNFDYTKYFMNSKTFQAIKIFKI